MLQASQHARYDTHGVREPDRFSFWREAVCDSFVRLGCEYDGGGQFDGSIDINRYPVIAFSRVGGTRHRVLRRRYDISRSTENDFLLSLQLRRTASVDQHGNFAELQPRDFAIYDSTEPYALNLTDGFDMMVLQFPKDRLLSRLPDAELLTGLKVDGERPLGGMVSDNLLHMARLMNDQCDVTRVHLQESILDLVAGALAGLRGSRYELSLPEQHILLRAKTHIMAHLADLELGRESVAKSVGVSVRRLSEIFASADLTIAGFIREKRLERAASDLRDLRFTNHSIAQIALRNGFGNFQYFSSLFRQRFHCTPSEHRQARSN